MPIAAFSTRLFAGLIQAGTTQLPLFKVPAGYRVVVREIYVASAPSATNFFILYLQPAGLEVSRVLPGGNAGSAVEERRTVFHEGEEARGRMTVAAGSVQLSGYLLTGAGAPMMPTTLPA